MLHVARWYETAVTVPSHRGQQLPQSGRELPKTCILVASIDAAKLALGVSVLCASPGDLGSCNGSRWSTQAFASREPPWNCKVFARPIVALKYSVHSSACQHCRLSHFPQQWTGLDELLVRLIRLPQHISTAPLASNCWIIAAAEPLSRDGDEREDGSLLIIDPAKGELALAGEVSQRVRKAAISSRRGLGRDSLAEAES